MKGSICFITTGDIKTNASSKRALGMANYLFTLGWTISIIMEDTQENRHRVSLECDNSIDVIFFPSSSLFKEVKRKNEIINRLHPDYIYICALVFRNAVDKKGHYKKVVEHSELQSSFASRHFFRRIAYLFLEYYSLIYAKGCINASVYLQNLYTQRAKNIGKRRMPMLYLPYAYNKKICTIRNKNIKAANERYFVFLGSIVNNYGAMLMVKAFEIVCKCHPDAKLVLLGKGPDFDYIQDYVSTKKLESNIYLKGYVSEEEISLYFSNADAFISPMYNTIQDWARCPSKLYMYLPYKKPIITCKIGEPYETLKDKGIYFKENSVESLVEAIETLYDSDNWNLDIVPELYEWEHVSTCFDSWISKIFL